MRQHRNKRGNQNRPNKINIVEISSLMRISPEKLSSPSLRRQAGRESQRRSSLYVALMLEASAHKYIIKR